MPRVLNLRDLPRQHQLHCERRRDLVRSRCEGGCADLYNDEHASFEPNLILGEIIPSSDSCILF